jgi:nicotinate-nucleotide pyrophosphorylase (carboxylating)
MQKYWEDLIERALQEDIGSGDHSSNCAIPATAKGQVQLIVKQGGVLAGVEAAQLVFKKVDTTLEFEPLLKDGSRVKVGDIAFRLKGRTRSLLQGERIALNIMQRMSGIATYTNSLVQKIRHTQAKILDTRKTTPTLRFMEKEAVKIGGAYNHRFGLYDMIMLKDNHIDFAGGVKPALQKAKNYLKDQQLDIPIEVETRNEAEIKEALAEGGVSRIMFDNFSPKACAQAVKLVQGACQTEASGGITENTLVAYAETGVDFISIGALTHSVIGLDMSLKAYA